MGNARLVHGREKEKQRVRHTSHEEKSWEKVIFWAENSELFLYFFEILCFYWDVGYRVMQGGSIFLLFNPLVVFLCRYLTKTTLTESQTSSSPTSFISHSNETVYRWIFWVGQKVRISDINAALLLNKDHLHPVKRSVKRQEVSSGSDCRFKRTTRISSEREPRSPLLLEREKVKWMSGTLDHHLKDKKSNT